MELLGLTLAGSGEAVLVLEDQVDTVDQVDQVDTVDVFLLLGTRNRPNTVIKTRVFIQLIQLAVLLDRGRSRHGDQRKHQDPPTLVDRRCVLTQV